MYSFGYFPGVRLWFADVSEPSISSIFKGCILYIQPLKMELIEGSETSENHNRTPGKYPKEYIQDSKYGESLKSRRITKLHLPSGRMKTESHACNTMWNNDKTCTFTLRCSKYCALSPRYQLVENKIIYANWSFIKA